MIEHFETYEEVIASTGPVCQPTGCYNPAMQTTTPPGPTKEKFFDGFAGFFWGLLIGAAILAAIFGVLVYFYQKAQHDSGLKEERALDYYNREVSH